jgi:UDP-2-acetamido-2,6-beta-L-arabino-hexul-4-ose reductase
VTTVLVTGASGFIGKNLCVSLKLRENIRVLEYGRENSLEQLNEFINKADFIYHLAGVNRPKNEEEFQLVNSGLTERVIEALRSNHKKIPILLSSSAQAEIDNPYGRSKVTAEKTLLEWSEESESPVYIYRLPGVFGKWCKPNYNSVVATFCNNIANNLPIEVSDSSHSITLTYIDDIVSEFIDKLDNRDAPLSRFCEVPTTFKTTLGELKDRIIALRDIRSTLVVPSLEDNFNKYLYATYLSYLRKDDFAYELTMHSDDRGSLTEFIKSASFGQIFTSTTGPGVSRGNHWHHTKIEKFFVISGEAEVSFRNKVDSAEIIRYNVSGSKPTVVDVPTGYVHAITNTGDSDLITLFWANEILDKQRPDTYYEQVKNGE